MRKGTAILLLLVLLFNLAGYRLVFYYAQERSDARMVQQLDGEGYNEADLITLRVPLTLPYHTDWAGFERVDGEILLDGKIYKYVKRKVEDGHMVLQCLPDRNKMALEDARTTFFKIANELEHTGDGSKSTPTSSLSFKNIWTEYDPHTADWRLQAPEACAVVYRPRETPPLQHLVLQTPAQPPERFPA